MALKLSSAVGAVAAPGPMLPEIPGWVGQYCLIAWGFPLYSFANVRFHVGMVVGCWLLLVTWFFASKKKTCADSVKRSCQAAGMKSFLGT